MNEIQEVIRVRRVSKSFRETQALDECSLRARSGEIHALVGENGSGKSTLAKILSGVIEPDSGEVEVLGATPRSPRHASELGVGTVFQEVLVAEGASVLDNLFIGTDGLWRAAMSMQEKIKRGGALLERLTGTEIELRSSVDDHPLSVRQSITIARALLRRPRVLILDESTAALDLAGVARLFDELHRLKAANACILFVTHRIAELVQIADRTTVLRDGAHVGTVERAETDESSLIELMTGHEVLGPLERAEAARDESALGPVLLRTADLRLSARSEPVDFELRGGEIVGVAGLEGHGQEEFVRAVCGIHRAVAGEVLIAGPERDELISIDDLATASANGVTYVPGDRKLEGLFPNLSILDNFAMPLFRRHRQGGLLDLGAIRGEFDRQTEQLSIRLARRTAPIGTLSGGNQQKVIIGRSLALEPRVLVLNDPTRGVDHATKAEVYDLLRALVGEGRAILLLSTQIEEFVGLCSRLAVFRDGSIHVMLAADRITLSGVMPALFGRAANDFEEAVEGTS